MAEVFDSWGWMTLVARTRTYVVATLLTHDARKLSFCNVDDYLMDSMIEGLQIQTVNPSEDALLHHPTRLLFGWTPRSSMLFVLKSRQYLSSSGQLASYWRYGLDVSHDPLLLGGVLEVCSMGHLLL